MVPNALYERFHRETRPLWRIPSEQDFDYSVTLPFFKRYARPGHEIIDIGCGAGPYCLYFASRGSTVFGLDVSHQAINAARLASHRMGVGNASFEVADFMGWEADRRFDVAIASEVFEHLSDDHSAARRIFRLLHPGGILLATVPLRQAPLHRLKVAIRGLDKFDLEVGHLRRYNGADIVHMLNAEGFGVIDMQWAEGLLRNTLFLAPGGRLVRRLIRGPVVRWATLLDAAALRLFGPSQLLIAARRP